MPVVIAVLLALLWVFALRRWYRQAPTPLESVEHQQRALDALQHAASRSRSGPPAPAAAGDRPLRNVSLSSAGRPQRSLAPLGVALVGSLVLGGTGVAWWVGRDAKNKQSASTATSTTLRAATSTTVGPTTTTAAAPPVAHATLTRQTATALNFTVDRPAFILTVAASGRCWVRAQDANQSATALYEGVLRSGDSQPIQVNGSAVVRFGAANNVTLTLDGQPLSLPGQFTSTLTLTLNGSTNGA
jgi:hypothetical protein